MYRAAPRRAQSLTRLGLVPGTEAECRRRAPLGDPTLYRWRGTDIALRRAEAEQIEVKSNK